MTAKSFSKISDFFIKAVIIFTTIIALLHFARFYNTVVLSTLALLTTIALVVKGIADFLIAREN